jgi:hypothetical protein
MCLLPGTVEQLILLAVFVILVFNSHFIVSAFSTFVLMLHTLWVGPKYFLLYSVLNCVL